jgi:hypothetical protein
MGRTTGGLGFQFPAGEEISLSVPCLGRFWGLSNSSRQQFPWDKSGQGMMQRLQNKVLRTIGNFPRRTPVRDSHMAFKLLYIYDYITKLCRQQAEVIQNNENANVRNMGQAKSLTQEI